ncbi:MAG: hypothetical protein P8Y96_02045 [Desulfuromonadales bacterium]|jgi:protocatechuate 3,4-dioxygenase beta subunit
MSQRPWISGFLSLLLVAGLVICGLATPLHAAQEYACSPTQEDEMGPLYRPGAPVRHSVGEGYLLMGRVKSAVDCAPIAHARIEIWLAGPEGFYGDDWRATLFSAAVGTYYFRSHVPPRYGLGRPHIHLRVSAPGFLPLVTQHYPQPGAGEAVFDLVLKSAEQ